MRWAPPLPSQPDRPPVDAAEMLGLAGLAAAGIERAEQLDALLFWRRRRRWQGEDGQRVVRNGDARDE